jgi:NAD(P)-dependent dehydrogenase (short-subunit alcohol dehydrogenase family)
MSGILITEFWLQDFSNFWADPEQDSKYKIFEINVNHPIKLTRLAIRACLGKRKKGVVLITASIAGYSGQYPAPLYSSSKHAIIGFTRSMVDTGKYQGVKVVTICPGFVFLTVSFFG